MTKRFRRIYLLALVIFFVANVIALRSALVRYGADLAAVQAQSDVKSATLGRVLDSFHSVLRAEAVTILAFVWLGLAFINWLRAAGDDHKE